MEKVKQDAVLGFVFFAALGVLLAGTLLLTNFSFTARPRQRVQFENAVGLEVGDPVYVLGKRVGEVLEVEYLPGQRPYRILATLQFDVDVALRADAKISIVDANLLGGKRVEIEPGTDANVFPGERIPLGLVKANALEALGEMLSGDDNKANLEGFLAGLNDVVRKINVGEGTLGKLINDSAVYDSFAAAVDSARNSLQAIERGESLIGRAVHDKALGDDLQAIATSLRSVGEKLDSGTGLAATILNDERVAESFRAIVEDVRTVSGDLRNGTGTLGMLFRDAELAQKVRTVVDDIADVTAKARNPDAGLIGALLADDKLLADGRAFMSGLREITDSINNGSGLLARLIKDEDMGRQFGQILGQVQRAIEDAREAAPVGSFFQVLTGFF